MGSTRLDYGSEAGIWASWQEFELLSGGLSEVGVWASRLEFGPWGSDFTLMLKIRASS